MDFKVRKGLRGWAAETEVELTNVRRLNIHTYRSDSGVLVSRAHVYELEGDFKVFKFGQDFQSTLAVKAARATEKAIRSLHGSVLQEHFEQTKQAALNHYSTQGDLL